MDNNKGSVFADWMASTSGLMRIEEQTVDINEKCLQLCQKYLSGVWTQLPANRIRITRLTGGLVNLLYLCEIADKSEPKTGDDPIQVAQEEDREAGVPTQAIIRFNGPVIKGLNIDPDNQAFNVRIIATLVSKAGLGPHLYGMDPEGQVMRYYPHRVFDKNDLDNPILLEQLAYKLARIHLLQAPIGRDRDRIQTSFANRANKMRDQSVVDRLSALFAQYKCHLLKGFDLRAEMLWMNRQIETYWSAHPLVLSHNDFRGGNIMVTEGSDPPVLVICDYDYTACSIRGFDFGYFFGSFITTGDIPAGVPEPGDHLPYESHVRQFVGHYVDECGRLAGDQWLQKPYNMVDSIVSEVMFAVLVSYLFMISIMVDSDLSDLIKNTPLDESTMMTIMEQTVHNYLLFKRLLIIKGVIRGLE